MSEVLISDKISETALEVFKKINVIFLDFYIIEDQYINELIDALRINQMIDTLNSSSHFFLSLCYNQLGQIDSSLHYMKKYNDFNQSDLLSFLMLANYYENQEDWLSSLENYQKVVWLDKHNIIAKNGVAFSLYNLKNFESAIDGYQNIFSLDDCIVNISKYIII